MNKKCKKKNQTNISITLHATKDGIYVNTYKSKNQAPLKLL